MLTNKRVGFDARPVLASYSGIGQYVRQLFPAMFRLNPPLEWIAYASPEALSYLNVGALLDQGTLKSSASRWRPGWMDRFSEPLDIFHRFGGHIERPCRFCRRDELVLRRQEQERR